MRGWGKQYRSDIASSAAGATGLEQSQIEVATEESSHAQCILVK